MYFIQEIKQQTFQNVYMYMHVKFNFSFPSPVGSLAFWTSQSNAWRVKAINKIYQDLFGEVRVGLLE